MIIIAVLVAISLTHSSEQAAAIGESSFRIESREQAHGSGGAEVELLAHDMTVTVMPDRHRLIATDRVTVKIAASDLRRISFSLNRALRVNHIQERKEDSIGPLEFMVQNPHPSPREGEGLQQVTVRLLDVPQPGQVLTLEWSYEGEINDPPREPRHLRFVTPSETAGHIGPEGVYLSGETHWYPDRPRSLAVFSLRVTTPKGWEAVTHGRQRARQTSSASRDDAVTAEWEAAERTEALTLVANRFVKAWKDWQDPGGRTIEVATYLFPDEAGLAEEYLEASVRYLEAYSKLLGPYPFPKFAVVENFFASGLGMPSFTLLGSGIIKRHYVQPYALGHEIVHSWLGNWVFNNPETGNWVEGLTTYLANYYYDELTGKPEQAREQRRMMLLGYAVYVWPEQDYPIAGFRHKTDQKDNAIGYQKAAMVFHMLRREVGEEAFWLGLRKVVAERGSAYATWSDLERVFDEVGGQKLRWFFAQWVERAGAPVLEIVEASARPAEGGDRRFIVTLRLRQVQVGRSSGPVLNPAEGSVPRSVDGPHRLRVTAFVQMGGGQVHRAGLAMDSAEQTFVFRVPGQPQGLQVDPDYETFRRLARESLPPMLNLYVTDRERAMALPDQGTDEERMPYRELAGQIASRDQAIKQVTDQHAPSVAGSILVLGGPGLNRTADWAIRGCGGGVRLEKDRFTVAGKTYEGSEKALLVSCRDPDHPDRVVTLFYGVTAQAAAKVARLLFFYGWQSYLVFQDGVVATRGDFAPSRDELEVRFPDRDK
jgi:hypothetical protein